MPREKWTPTTLLPAQPGWIAVYENPDGAKRFPVLAWALCTTPDGEAEVMAMLPAARGLHPAEDAYVLIGPDESFKQAEERMLTVTEVDYDDMDDDIRTPGVIAGGGRR
jgi:hypothetical protein